MFGVTFVAVAPEHPIVSELAAVSRNGAAIAAYVVAAASRLGANRFDRVDRDEPGVRTDVSAVHPLTGEALPIVVADYVIADYGTGVVMGVPAHDARDLEFARSMDLDIRQVVLPVESEGAAVDGDAFVDDGILTGSSEFDGHSSEAARAEIASRLATLGFGGPAKVFRLHDWLVSRQRYWGTPIPIVYCSSCGEVPVPEDQLPVLLPPVDDVIPTGTGLSPLAAVESFVETTCPVCGEPARRETDVLDAFVESSWYYLRYPSHDRPDVPWDPGANVGDAPGRHVRGRQGARSQTPSLRALRHRASCTTSGSSPSPSPSPRSGCTA